MKELGLIVIGVVLGLFFGYLIGINGTVEEEYAEAKYKEYEQTIQFYQDYIDGLDKVLNLDTLNNGALDVLRDKLPQNNEGEYKAL